MSEKFFTNEYNRKYNFLKRMKIFHDRLLSTIWLIQSNNSSEKDALFGTRFFVDAEGHILTCAHIIKNKKFIEVLNLKKDKEILKVSVVRIYTVWDMALFKVNGNENDKFDFVKLVDVDDEVFCGKEVRSIGNPNALYKSFISVWIAHPVSSSYFFFIPHLILIQYFFFFSLISRRISDIFFLLVFLTLNGY